MLNYAIKHSSHQYTVIGKSWVCFAPELGQVEDKMNTISYIQDHLPHV